MRQGPVTVAPNHSRRPTGRSAASALALLLLVATPSGATPPEDGFTPPDNPLQGRLLFESKQCNRCHGVAGSGPGIGPSLSEGRFTGTFLDLGAALWNHVPGMSVTFEVTGLSWPTLSAAETEQLISFLYFIDYLGRPGIPPAGRRVFESGGCASCHSIGAAETGIGPDLARLERFASPLYVAQQIWNHGPSMFESMRRRSLAPPSFREGDLADLSAFIRQQAPPGPREPMLLAPGNPNRGAELFSRKGCATCHGRMGAGGQGGPDLRDSDLQRSAEGIAATMWNHALAMSDIMREQGVGWPQFEDSELADLVAFLYFLPFADPPGDPKGGARVFRERACADCHAADEEAPQPQLLKGPSLAGIPATGSPGAFVAALWNHAPLMKRAILSEGRPWPELSGEELRNLRAFLQDHGSAP